MNPFLDLEERADAIRLADLDPFSFDHDAMRTAGPREDRNVRVARISDAREANRRAPRSRSTAARSWGSK